MNSMNTLNSSFNTPHNTVLPYFTQGIFTVPQSAGLQGHDTIQSPPTAAGLPTAFEAHGTYAKPAAPQIVPAQYANSLAFAYKEVLAQMGATHSACAVRAVGKALVNEKLLSAKLFAEPFNCRTQIKQIDDNSWVITLSAGELPFWQELIIAGT